MMIEGITGSLFKEVQGKTNHQTSSVNGPGFIESLNQMAASAQMVVRGGQLSSAGLHDRKMVQDWMKDPSGKEDEESLEEIFSKIDRIEEILKETFSK